VRVTRSGDPGGAAGGASRPTYDYVWGYEYRPQGGSGAAADLAHIIAAVTNPNGNSTAYTYLTDNPVLPNRRRRLSENVSNLFAWSFDGAEVAVADVTDGNGEVTTYTVEDGLVKTIQTPGGAITTMFDESGLKIYESDAAGLVKLFQYDDRGNVVRLEQRGRNDVIVTTASFDLTFNSPPAALTRMIARPSIGTTAAGTSRRSRRLAANLSSSNMTRGEI